MNLPATTIPATDQRVGPANKPDESACETSRIKAHSLYELLAQQPFFKGLTARQVQVLAESAMEIQFELGEAIFAEGSPANRFYLIATDWGPGCRSQQKANQSK